MYELKANEMLVQIQILWKETDQLARIMKGLVTGTD